MSRAFSALVAVTLSTVASADLIEIAGDRPTLVQNFGVGSPCTVFYFVRGRHYSVCLGA